MKTAPTTANFSATPTPALIARHRKAVLASMMNDPRIKGVLTREAVNTTFGTVIDRKAMEAAMAEVAEKEAAKSAKIAQAKAAAAELLGLKPESKPNAVGLRILPSGDVIHQKKPVDLVRLANNFGVPAILAERDDEFRDLGEVPGVQFSSLRGFALQGLGATKAQIKDIMGEGGNPDSLDAGVRKVWDTILQREEFLNRKLIPFCRSAGFGFENGNWPRASQAIGRMVWEFLQNDRSTDFIFSNLPEMLSDMLAEQVAEEARAEKAAKQRARRVDSAPVCEAMVSLLTSVGLDDQAAKLIAERALKSQNVDPSAAPEDEAKRLLRTRAVNIRLEPKADQDVAIYCARAVWGDAYETELGLAVDVRKADLLVMSQKQSAARAAEAAEHTKRVNESADRKPAQKDDGKKKGGKGGKGGGRNNKQSQLED